ncbi:MAG: hypothetical protein HQM02_12800 [Magnetococcales bacterium]|nr:hypothetical protein [Magnetococcales bacterium]
MNSHLNKRKQGALWHVVERFAGDRPFERPSVLDKQKIDRRSRGKCQDSRPESRMDPPLSAKDAIRRRYANAHPLAVSRLLEGGVVLAAGLSLIVKNGISNIAGWIREGREMVSGSEAEMRYEWRNAHGEELEEGIWDGDEGQESSHRVHNPDLEHVAAPPEVDDPMVLPSASTLRVEKELNKVSLLDAEEDGLPTEELEDQAGALRAMFSESSRKS